MRPATLKGKPQLGNSSHKDGKMLRESAGARGSGRPAAREASMGSTVLGARIRAERERQKRSLREFARSLNISASMISQIECGRAMPSVGTLFAIATALDLPFDHLFANGEPSPIPSKKPDQLKASDMVQRQERRIGLRLENDVRWERLTALPDDHVEFVHVVYEPGAMSAPDKKLMHHGGKEYGYLISGQLGMQVGDQEVALRPGDSISFNSQLPHRLWTIGDEKAVAIWFIVNRTDDPRRFETTERGEAPKKPAARKASAAPKRKSPRA